MKKNKKIFNNVNVLDIGAKGLSICKTKEDIVIMVKNGVPGDIVDVETYKKKKNYFLGNITKYHSFSKNRTNPKCSHFGLCGGCGWQNMLYESQTKYKELKIKHLFKNIFNIDEVKPIVNCDENFYYRNKLEFSFTDNRWLTESEVKSKKNEIDRVGIGFHLSGKWNKVVDIERCYLQNDPSNKIRLSLKDFSKKNNITFYNSKFNKGLLRSLMIRNSSLNEFMVVMQFYENKLDDINKIMIHLKQSFKEIKSLQYIINNKKNDSIYDQKINLFYGKAYINEKIKNLNFKIYPKSFFQTNIKQTVILYEIVKKLTDLKGKEIVYDLYSGLGTISQFVSDKAYKVIGIESVIDAVKSAKKSAIDNKINNVEFVAGDIKSTFNKEFIEKYGKANLIITDPPRDGMHKKVINEILKLEVPKILYISCNPSTQFRDLEVLNNKYEIVVVQPIDMFPHTNHVENIVLLKLRDQ